MHRRRAAGAQRRARSGALTLIRAAASVIAMAAVILRLGWEEPWLAPGTLLWIEGIGLAVYALTIIASMRADPGGRSRVARAARANGFECAVLAFGFAFVWSPVMLASAVTLLFLYQALSLYLWVVQTSAPPGLVFAGSFLVLIAAGTGGLMLPNSTPADKPIGLVDALFTSTSAVCVTGLVVRDTGTEFTRLGQTIILLLIQLGGLGIILFGALLALTMGSAMGLRVSRTLAEGAAEGHARPSTIRALIVFITVATLLTELVGAATLFVGWPRGWAGAPAFEGAGDRAFHAVFFSVSAFCNAGFATSADSLQGLRFHWTSHIIMVGLIVVGGIGLPVLDNIRSVVWAKWRGRRMSNQALIRLNLHTKIVLTTTAAVYIAGALAIMLGRLTQGGEPWHLALLDGHFMSVTARTAGFDTVAPAEMGPMSRLSLLTLMFIGGSPGSAAGGVKTVSVAIIVLTIWATMRGKATTEAFGRSIPENLVRRAATLITLGAGIIALLTLALALTDGRGRLLGDLLFEVVSASSTVGLSTGLTGELSPPGRVILIIAMFTGRLGPLVILAALVSVGRRPAPHRHYPSESVVMS